MNKNIIEILTEKFPEQEFELEKTNYGGVITAFFIKSKTEDVLIKNWEKIRNTIGVYFQSALELEFDIWNIYLFFILPNAVSKELKHKIEHDTISSRKIMVDESTIPEDKDCKQYLFSEHITNENLNISALTESKIVFSKSNTLSPIIDSISLTKAKKNKEEILGEALTNIENKLRK